MNMLKQRMNEMRLTPKDIASLCNVPYRICYSHITGERKIGLKYILNYTENLSLDIRSLIRQQLE